MSATSELSGLKYVLEETQFHETKFGFMIIQDALGPLNPGPSFVLYGNLFLDSEGKALGINVSAKGPNFPASAGLGGIEWRVTATLTKNGQELCRKPVIRHYEHYFINPNSTVVGEANFTLPEFTERNAVTLILEGTYFADLGPYGNVAPKVVGGIGPIAKIRKEFMLRVEREEAALYGADE